MSPDPVEDPLNEMLAALKEGADRWTIPQAIGDAYKAQLRPDFGVNKEHWDAVSEKLKRMARHSGSLAGLVAQCSNPNGEPRNLTVEEVFRGAAIVKESMACPRGFGRFCAQADFGTLQEALDSVFGAGKVTVNDQL
jgi:hypothetical protein